MISEKYGITDKNLKRALDELEGMITAAGLNRSKGNITQSSINQVGDKVTFDEQSKRLVVRSGNKVYGTDMNEI